MRYFIQVDFMPGEEYRLCRLSDIADLLRRSLAEVPWLLHPALRVNRVDLASDHQVSGEPAAVCDSLECTSLPYSHVYRGQDDRGVPWTGIYHWSGKIQQHPVVVAHYYRLPSLLRRCSPPGEAAVEYTSTRLRQEIRFWRSGLRQRVGRGSMTVHAVLGSLPAFFDFAQRRLRPIYEAGILSPPKRDLPGEAAMLKLADVIDPRSRHADLSVCEAARRGPG